MREDDVIRFHHMLDAAQYYFHKKHPGSMDEGGECLPAVILSPIWHWPRKNFSFQKPFSLHRISTRRAGVRPGSRAPFVSAKGPKTNDAPPGLI
jgi:hypothetical protein